VDAARTEDPAAVPVSHVSPSELAAVLAADPSITLIDVRNPDEYAGGHVPGAELMPMHTVPVRVQDLPRHAPIYVVCHSGGRSMQVCAWLDNHGYDVVNVDGGTGAWALGGHPLER
jgi:rhodanese-related sulfurtransferase